MRVLRLELLVLVELKCNGLYFLVRLLVDSGLGEDKGLVLDRQRRLPPRAAVLGALPLGQAGKEGVWAWRRGVLLDLGVLQAHADMRVLPLEEACVIEDRLVLGG